MKERFHRTKEVIDASQHTQIQQVNENKTKKKTANFKVKYLFRLKNFHHMANKPRMKLFE